jgi:hypothetical protein
MTWYVTLGGHYGGNPETSQVAGLSSTSVELGASFTIYGSGFTPGTTVILSPGDVVVGESRPTVTDEITVTMPTNLPNIKHLLTVFNGTTSNYIEIFVTRAVTFTNASGQEIDVVIGGLN